MESQPAQTEALLKKVFEEWRPDVGLEQISAITPDASLRRYYRLFPQVDSSSTTGLPRSVVAMVFDSVKSAEASGATTINSDDAYVQLTELFVEHGVRVPKIYYDARKSAVLLIEDCGIDPLFSLLGVNSSNQGNADQMYLKAIDQIFKIQAIQTKPGMFAFERFFGRSLYLSELKEFSEFLLGPLNPPKSVGGIVEQFAEKLADRLESLPRVLVHRDYHSWNLLLGYDGSVRVIDFQDALMGTRTYDLVGLLNDRDTDAALGENRYSRLLNAFIENCSTAKSGQDAVREEYYLALLQRDLKVAGRFSKLVSVRGLPQYGVWIPGTLRRIGRTLSVLSSGSSDAAVFSQMLNVLSGTVKEIADGSKRKFADA